MRLAIEVRAGVCVLPVVCGGGVDVVGKLEAALFHWSLGWQSRGLPPVPPRLLYANDS